MDPGGPPVENVNRILESPPLKALLLQFMEESYCAECLRFYDAAVSYRSIEHSFWRMVQGKRIVGEFVAPGASNVINVEWQTAQRILAAATGNQWHADTFLEAQQEVFRIIASDVYQTFAASAKYRAAVAEALKSTIYIRPLESRGLNSLLGPDGSTRFGHFKCGVEMKGTEIVVGDNPGWGKTRFTQMDVDVKEVATVEILIGGEGRNAHQVIARGAIPMNTFVDEAPRELWVTLEPCHADNDVKEKEETEVNGGTVPLAENDGGESEADGESVPEVKEEASSPPELQEPPSTPRGPCGQVYVQAILIRYPSPEKHLWSVFSSPLHTCAAFGLPDAIRTLVLQYGIDVDTRIDTNRRTSLHIACLRGQWKLVTVLVRELKADVDAVDNHGQTALHLCAKFAPDLMHILISGGAYVNAKDLMGRGETPLHSACAYAGSPDAVRLLIESGADVDSATVEGESPLHVGVTQNNPTTVMALLEYGANVHAKDDNKKTPLDLARAAKDWNENSAKVWALVEDAARRLKNKAAARK